MITEIRQKSLELSVESFDDNVTTKEIIERAKEFNRFLFDSEETLQHEDILDKE